MFPETSCQCPRPKVITQWWPGSVSLSQISIVHSSLLSSVASRSLSFVKHSANIHNLLLLFLFFWTLIEPPHFTSAWCIASISQSTNIFGSFYQKSIFLSSSVSFLCSGGVWEPRTGLCDHISGISCALITNAYLVYRNKISANVCILPSWYPGWRPFSHLRKFKIIMRG